MSEKPSQLSRRTALKIIAGSVSVTGSGPLLKGASGCRLVHHSAVNVAVDSAPYVPKFFNPDQMKTLDLLSEVILPQDATFSGCECRPRVRLH